MKKIIIWMIIGALCINMVSCKKKDQTETTEGTTSVIQTTEIKTTEKTVSGDVYDSGTTEVTGTVNNEADATLVTDIAVQSELQMFLNKFYYNFYFKPTGTDGSITESDMQLFAISYVYQFENQELNFDPNKFLLYIPEDHVSEVIDRFFDHDFVNHGYPQISEISYEDGFYLMPATEDNFGVEPTYTKILQLSDFEYKAYFEVSGVDGEGKKILTQYEATIEEREGRFIMTNYKVIVVPVVAPTEATTVAETEAEAE